MRKLAIIIDFNNIAMRSMFTCQYMGDSMIKNFDTDKECEILIRKIVSDLSNVLRMFSPDRVIVACDAKDPWRNKIYDENGGEKYKGNREKDENKNWDNIFKSFNELKDILKSFGMIVTELNNTEADDLAVLWRNVLIKEDFNVIMVSSDKDWSQLVVYRENSNPVGQFCISYNPIATKQVRKIYVTEEFMNWYNSKDVSDIFFSNYDEIKNKLKDIMRCNPKVIFEVINPNMILLDKIMCGDDGDNVPAFFDYYKNGKKMRVTPLKASHIYESLGISNVSDLESTINEGAFGDALEKEMKRSIDLDFNKRFERQRKLVELNPRFFPEKILKSFVKHANENIESGYINTTSIKMEDILKGSRFLKEDYDKPRENSIFDDVKLLDKFSKRPNLF